MVVIAGKLGSSIAVCIPAELAGQLQIAPGTRLQVTNSGGRLVIEPLAPDMLQMVAAAPAFIRCGLIEK